MHIPVNRVFNNVSRNLGLKEYTEHIDSWAEWSFEAEQYIGSNKTFLEKEIVYSPSGPTAADAKIEFLNNPAVKSFIEINSTRFYFRTTSTADFVPGNVDDYIIPIEADLDTTMAGAVTILNSSNYDTLLGVNASWTAGGNTLTLTYNRGGDEGNHVTLMTSGGAKISQFFEGGKERLHNRQVRLPDNMVKLLSIRAGDVIVQPTSSQYKSKVSSLLDRFYINGNRVNFSTDYTSDVHISYLAVPMSPEGYPMILQGHEEAVAQYVMWKHKLVGYYAGEVPQYIVKDLERRWYQLCGKVRGDDNMPSSIELLKIGKIWNAKVPVTSFNPPLYDGLNSY
jgi:hypothetical protein